VCAHRDECMRVYVSVVRTVFLKKKMPGSVPYEGGRSQSNQGLAAVYGH
jgi:hypothetical protein